MDATPSPSPNPDFSGAGDQIDQWLREAREGTRSALGRALECVRDYLLLIARRELDNQFQSKVGASDLVQDTFVEAQRDFDRFRGTNGGEFHAWLVAILNHRLANNVRRYRQTKSRDVSRELRGEVRDVAFAGLRDDLITPGTAEVAREERERVQQALALMSEPLRGVLIERTWQEKSFKEIGESRGLTADAARKAWSRAVRELHRLLQQIE